MAEKHPGFPPKNMLYFSMWWRQKKMNKIAILILSFLIQAAIIFEAGAADTTIKGTGATSTTTALVVTNSSDTNLLNVRNDGNVGIGYSNPGTAQLAVNGNLGIGTVDPQNRLYVAANVPPSGPYVGGIALDNTNGTSKANGLNFNSQGNVLWTISNDWDENGVQTFAIYDLIADAHRLFIDEDGNVGIGTPNPSVRLEVPDGGRLGHLNVGLPGTPDTLENANVWGLYLQWSQSGNILMNLGGGNVGVGYDNPLGGKLLVNGNVGIGTTNPGTMLEINGDYVAGKGQLYINPVAGQNAFLSINSDANREAGVFFDTAGTAQWAIFRSSASNDLEFEEETTGWPKRMTLQAGGNVGIGTTSPTAVLQLKAGTATALTAPLKVTAGTNLATAEAGAVENDGKAFYLSPAASTRYSVPLLNNWSTASQNIASTTRTYVTGSQIAMQAGQLRIGTKFRWTIDITKTGAGVATSTFDICFGTNGTPGDTARVAFTKPAGTGVIDNCRVIIDAIVRGPLSGSGVVAGHFNLIHNLSITGFATIPCVNVVTVSGTFDVTTPTYVGVCITAGLNDNWTIQLVSAETWNL
jgi:hypothetical protein